MVTFRQGNHSQEPRELLRPGEPGSEKLVAAAWADGQNPHAARLELNESHNETSGSGLKLQGKRMPCRLITSHLGGLPRRKGPPGEGKL